MTLRLTVDEQRWRDHVARTIAEMGAPTAVVKGNGYGFGRAWLAVEAAKVARRIAVGTVHELDILADLDRAVAAGLVPPVESVEVLSPVVHVPADLPRSVLLTVGSPTHVEALGAAGWRGRVQIKLDSAMHRYGVETEHLDQLTMAIDAAGLDASGYAIHLPLPGPLHSEHESVADVERWLPHLDPTLPLTVSHLMPASVRALRQRVAPQPVELRVGTDLWLGDKSFLHLEADVLDVRRMPPSSSAGYRLTRMVDGGTLVMIGAGTAHGVQPLPDGRSPFHHRRERLALLEPPHMHTSMAFLRPHQQAPEVGDWVDVQRPMILTQADEIVWR